jgi:hypothetical protein
MTDQELEYIEKVRLPEYEGYGWIGATKIIRDLIAELRILERRLIDAEGMVPTFEPEGFEPEGE